MLGPHRQLRVRTPAPIDDLPISPTLTIFSGAAHADGRFAELGWKPSDGVEAGAFLQQWFTPSDLLVARLPVILTMEDVRGKWRPVTITAESLAVHGEVGLFAARELRGAEMFGSMLDGCVLGIGTSAKKWQKAIVAEIAPDARRYLYTLRFGKVHALFDGAVSRRGGPTRANDARDTDCKNNSMLWDTGAFCVLPHVIVPALTARGNRTQRRKSELLWDYGNAYWAIHG